MDLEQYLRLTDLPKHSGEALDDYAMRIALIAGHAGAAWAIAHAPNVVHVTEVIAAPEPEERVRGYAHDHGEAVIEDTYYEGSENL